MHSPSQADEAARSALQFEKMTKTPVPKLILGLAAPTILSMLITSIYRPTPSLWASCPPARRARWASCRA